MIKLPRWLLHLGIALNTAMCVGFYITDLHKMALISFLSACAFWLHINIEEKQNEE